jgi:hypothetical protein
MLRALSPSIFLSAVLALVLAPAAGAATPLTSAQVTGELNAFRAQHGFSSNVVENPVLDAGCDAHNAWMELNNLLVHAERPGTPGYSIAGDAAAKISILAQGPSWSDGNPWLNAPIHMADLLMPQMIETGASESHGRTCLTTHSLTNLRAAQPKKNTFWAYPRNGATLPNSQAAFEAPAPPQTFGRQAIRAGVPTGPNIITFLRGPQFAKRKPLLTSATMIGPGRVAVPVMTVHENQLIYLPPGAGVIVPRSPLVPGATYTWRATYTAPPVRRGAAAFRYTSPARRFTASSQKLCGSGIGGWFVQPCPSSVLRVTAPRRLTVARAAKGIRLGVRLDGRGWAGATLKAGRRSIATASGTVGASMRGTLTVRPSARSLRAALGRRRSTVIVAQLKSDSLYVRTVRITITR